MDPASGHDAVAHIGIRNGRIEFIGTRSIEGRTRIDAAGLVVSPGFVDLHQHAHTPEALRAKALDGVTAAFEMEMGVPNIDAWYAGIEGTGGFGRRTRTYDGGRITSMCSRKTFVSAS